MMGRINHKGGSNDRHNIIYFGKGPRWDLDDPRIAYEKAEQDADHKEASQRGSSVRGQSYTEASRSIGVSEGTGKV